MSRFRKMLVACTAVMLLLMLCVPVMAGASGTTDRQAGAAQSGPVFIIPVDQEIERGLQSFLERGFAEAANYGAVLIVLEIDTPGDWWTLPSRLEHWSETARFRLPPILKATLRRQEAT